MKRGRERELKKQNIENKTNLKVVIYVYVCVRILRKERRNLSLRLDSY